MRNVRISLPLVDDLCPERKLVDVEGQILRYHEIVESSSLHADAMTETADLRTRRRRDFPLADAFPRPPQADREEVVLDRQHASTLRRRSKLTDMPVELGSNANFASRCFGNFLLAVALVAAMAAFGLVPPARFDERPPASKAPAVAPHEIATSSP